MKRITSFLYDQLTTIIVLLVLALVATLAFLSSPNEDGTRTFNGEAPLYSEAMKEAYCEAKAGNESAIAGLMGINAPQDAGSGCAPTDIAQMGSLPYYKVNVSTPAAFYNAVNGKGFNEGYGLQCVAGFKQFMYALSGKYVATNTGGASGYAAQQKQIEPLGFKWRGGKSGLQDGDWGIFGGGQYGHVAMYYQGKWFGQNQGAANANVGNAFNLMTIGAENLIGYYRPNIYIKKPAPAPKPSTKPAQNTTNATGGAHTVKRGDTLGQVLLDKGWSTGNLWGTTGDANRSAIFNGISDANLILPGQVIRQTQ